MTQAMYAVVERLVTVIRGFRDGVRPRPAWRPIIRQALPFSVLKRLLDRGAATPAPLDATTAPTA
jgi:hypothetical protein